MTLVWLSIRDHAKAQVRTAELSKETVEYLTRAGESQTKLLDKAFALLSAKGPLEFQAVQAMSVGYTDDRFDPSEEAEADRLKAFGIIPPEEEGDLNGEGSADEELEWLRTHGVPGLPE